MVINLESIKHSNANFRRMLIVLYNFIYLALVISNKKRRQTENERERKRTCGISRGKSKFLFQYAWYCCEMWAGMHIATIYKLLAFIASVETSSHNFYLANITISFGWLTLSRIQFNSKLIFFIFVSIEFTTRSDANIDYFFSNSLTFSHNLVHLPIFKSYAYI